MAVHGTPAATTGFALAGVGFDVGVGVGVGVGVDAGAEVGADSAVVGVVEEATDGVSAASRTSAAPPAEQAVSTTPAAKVDRAARTRRTRM
ncbi:hypothetical protein [Amycolatopsis sp. NPDC004169]|uniref:hypothetical protein n=1 Tax=Amycolatopsis sp. NPDC004169 TaxID=3154453 RepID=UPI0033B0C246